MEKKCYQEIIDEVSKKLAQIDYFRGEKFSSQSNAYR
jgi:hypothetical protein